MRIFKTIWTEAKKPIYWVFRLFNLLEPDVDYPVFSISKISAWTTTFCTIWIATHNPGSEALAGSVAMQTVAMANYGYRRWVQYKSGTGAYGSLGTKSTDPIDQTTSST